MFSRTGSIAETLFTGSFDCYTMLFCSFLYRFLQSPDKRRDDVSPAGGECVEELCRALPMRERRSRN